MIVSEHNVQTALEYLAIDPHPIALARKDVTDAENKAKEIFARLYLSYSGPVAEREHRATANPEFQEAKAIEAEAIKELERHRARARAAEMLLEIFRTEAANVRASERIR